MPTTVDTPEVPGGIASRFDLTDRRTLIGLGIMAFCLGVMAGARLMRNVPMPAPGATPAPSGGVGPTERVVFRDVPGPVVYVPGDDCPGCAEAKVLEERRAAADAAARARVSEGQTPTDGVPASFTIPATVTEVPE